MGLGFPKKGVFANECLVIAIQCISIGIQCNGGPIRVDG